MKMQMRIIFNDETTKDCEAIFADFVAFERTWNRSVTKFETELRLTDIAWLAWKTQIRCKHTQEQFDIWLEKVETIDVVSEDVPDLPSEVETKQVPLD
jgi:hypothetical protein